MIPDAVMSETSGCKKRVKHLMLVMTKPSILSGVVNNLMRRMQEGRCAEW